MKKFFKEYINKDIKFDKKTWIAIFSIIIVFSGVFGWIYEFLFYYANSGFTKFYMRGSNFLPFINIYSWGSIMIFILCYRFRKKPIVIFLISFISTGLLEYFTGLIMYKYFGGIRCWDYSREILNFGNINGYVCLRSVLFFAISGMFLMYIVIPIIFYIAKHSDKKKFITISIIICSIFLLDEFYNLFIYKILDLDKASTIYKNLGIPYMKYFY